jgi:hypothetical protein
MSGVTFLKSVYGGTIPQSVDITVIKDRSIDADLNPTKSCSVYDKEFGKNDAKKWSSSKFEIIAKRISKEINIEITASQSKTLIDICISDIVLFKKSMNDGVCQLLTLEDLHMMDTSDDIMKFNTLGYGAPINSEMSCSLITGIVRDFRSSLIQNTKSHVSFTHAESIIPLIASLDLFKDDFKLNSTSSDELLKSRKFRISQISPFMGNALLELLSCDSEPKHVVRLWLNEKLHDIPGCISPCTLSNFELLARRFMDCNYDEVCKNTKHTCGSVSSSLC